KSVVDQAKALSGKFDKIGEARELINQAMSDSQLSQDAKTYYTAGKIEFDAFDSGAKAGLINPEAPSANPILMGEELLNGYELFLKALPLDSVPNEKGQIKPKYAKDIVGKLAGHVNDYFKAGAAFYEAKKFYPEAYNAFIIYATMPDMAFMGDKAPKLNDVDRGQSFFNAGLAAWSGNEPVKSADAFRDARGMGFDDVNAYVYELACWQNLAQKDSTMAETAKNRIMAVAKEGNDKFGMAQPVFLNNMISCMVHDNRIDESIAAINTLMESNPDNASLYGLRAYVYDRAGKDAESIADYKAAAKMPNVDFETLKNAAKKLYRDGTEKYNSLEMSDREGRMQVKADYFMPAKEIVDKANELNPGDSDMNYVTESINYALETFFK
ncbi:MAG: hypothetical protein K2M03_02480, partial [Muribaculaceae bacterium]|nr:hypothetical protein [Muribaculaceae bacterium]